MPTHGFKITTGRREQDGDPRLLLRAQILFPETERQRVDRGAALDVVKAERRGLHPNVAELGEEGHGSVAVVGTPAADDGDPSLINAFRPDLHLEIEPCATSAGSVASEAPLCARRRGLGNEVRRTVCPFDT